MTSRAKASHIASALSVADIVAVLYGSHMRIYPEDPRNPERDRFVLSKGHAGTAVYAALAECGFISLDDLLDNYYKNGSKYSGHVSHVGVAGVEFSTGSLGHGVCVACGMALSGKLGKKDYRVFAVVGDGECDEGSVWETALLANQYELDNFTIIVDRNDQQSFGHCKETALDLMDLGKKFSSFGWTVFDVNGHDHGEIKEALDQSFEGKPKCIVAHTVKGKGVSFMEDEVVWHYRDVQGEQLEQALREVSGNL